MSHQQYLGYLERECNEIPLWRYDRKNGVEDLQKAKVYLEWLIDEQK
jgi:hypothetical protein